METKTKTAGAMTPTKNPNPISKKSENSNPNIKTPISKFPNSSPSMKSASKAQKTVSKNPNPLVSPSPRNKIRGRKFVVAKKSLKREKAGSSSSTVNCKCNNNGGGSKSFKCLCVAYESLRASQEEFFKNPSVVYHENVSEHLTTSEIDEIDVEEEEEKGYVVLNSEIGDGFCGKITEENDLDKSGGDEIEMSSELGGGINTKRRRDKLLEEARESVPEPGSGIVSHLVKAFEKLLSIPKDSDQKEEDKELEDTKKGMKWALPGLQPPIVPETQVSVSSFSPSDFFLTSESLGLDSLVTSSLDSSHGSFSSMTSFGGGRRSRRNSTESSGTFGGRQWKRRQLRSTSQKPFKLRTEQRGRCKEEEFIKKVQQMMEEEEKQRIPIAQGLPWTTDEPESLAKPPVKEPTRLIDLVLHSDIRAVERSDFDHQMAEKMNFIEQYRMERERQQKLAEEEEIRRLRKELVPKAQPMPYFDRPFIPRRSMKHPTIPKEPKFHIPQHKKIKCCASWSDLYTHQ